MSARHGEAYVELLLGEAAEWIRRSRRASADGPSAKAQTIIAHCIYVVAAQEAQRAECHELAPLSGFVAFERSVAYPTCTQAPLPVASSCSHEDHAILRADAVSWELLPLYGYQEDGEGGTLELRRCARCQSALAKPISGTVTTNKEVA